MGDVYGWCTKNVVAVKALVESFSANQPDREVRSPIRDNVELVRISGEIESALSTLRYVSNSRAVLKDLKGLVGNERTPDHAFFGPAPNLLIGDTAGFGTALGVAADLGSALTAVIKGARADAKLRKKLQAGDTADIKLSMLKDYESLVLLLEKLVERAAEHEVFAERLHQKGLNIPILNDAWRVAQNCKWLILAS